MADVYSHLKWHQREISNVFIVILLIYIIAMVIF